MNKRVIAIALLASTAALTGCVSKSGFEDRVIKMEARITALEEANKNLQDQLAKSDDRATAIETRQQGFEDRQAGGNK